MKIAVIGGSGYVGRALIQQLVTADEHDIVSVSLHAESADYGSDKVVAKNTDIFDTKKLHAAIKDCDAVYYLVHMMAQKKYDFVEAEALAAESLVKAIKKTSVMKIIYLGGLGSDKEKLSRHLASRQHTGKLLLASQAQTIEFRASMVIGQGSVSYDIIANIVRRLPILFLPSWAKTYTQPIGLHDAVRYLVAGLTVQSEKDEIIEIGGPEAVTYEDLMLRYATWKETKTLSVHVPFVPVSVAAWWLNLFTPGHHAKVGHVMVESLANPMVVTNDRAYELFPDIEPDPLEDTFV